MRIVVVVGGWGEDTTKGQISYKNEYSSWCEQLLYDSHDGIFVISGVIRCIENVGKPRAKLETREFF